MKMLRNILMAEAWPGFSPITRMFIPYGCINSRKRAAPDPEARIGTRWRKAGIAPIIAASAKSPPAVSTIPATVSLTCGDAVLTSA